MPITRINKAYADRYVIVIRFFPVVWLLETGCCFPDARASVGRFQILAVWHKKPYKCCKHLVVGCNCLTVQQFHEKVHRQRHVLLPSWRWRCRSEERRVE